MQQSDNQTISSVHLTALRSDAVFLTSNNIVSAFNFIAIECSNLSINCFSSDRDEAGCNSSDIKTIVSVHLIVSRPSAACLTLHSIVSASDDIDIRCSNVLTSKSTVCLPHSLITASHSFERFFYVIEKSLIDFYTHSFDQVFFKKRHQSSTFQSKSFSYRTQHMQFQRKISEIKTVNQHQNTFFTFQQMIISTFQQMIISTFQ